MTLDDKNEFDVALRLRDIASELSVVYSFDYLSKTLLNFLFPSRQHFCFLPHDGEHAYNDDSGETRSGIIACVSGTTRTIDHDNSHDFFARLTFFFWDIYIGNLLGGECTRGCISPVVGGIFVTD